MPRARDAQGRFVGTGAKRKNSKAKSPPAKARAPEALVDAIAARPSEPFLSELQADWARHGAATIERVRDERPHDYLRLMASSLAKQVDGKADAIDAMSDDEIAEELRRVLDRLGAGGADPGAGAGAAEEA